MPEHHDHHAITSISEARQRVERARAALTRAEADLDRRVAGASGADQMTRSSASDHASGRAMSGRLVELADGSHALEPELVTMVAVAVYDRGPLVDRSERYEAQLAGYSVVQARAASSWQAVRRLVSEHRALLERRWSGGAGS